MHTESVLHTVTHVNRYLFPRLKAKVTLLQNNLILMTVKHLDQMSNIRFQFNQFIDIPVDLCFKLHDLNNGILESAGINPETMNLQEIESRYEKLCADRKTTSDAYKKAEKECEKLKQSRDALLSFIGQEPSQEIDRDKKIIR